MIISDNIVLREEDVMECAAGGMTPAEAIRQSISLSSESFILHAPTGEPLCYWGFRRDTTISAHAYLWLLSTPDVDRHKVFFARWSKEEIEDLLEQFYKLSVLVHIGHKTAIGWLEWLGFVREDCVGEFYSMVLRNGGAA